MVRVVKGVPVGWGVCSRTILLGSFTRTLSYCNNTIVVGTQHGDITIFNAITGSQSAVLSGHPKRVNCVVFLLDGASLVSGSNDWTVKLWDIQTGGVIKTFFGHTDVVWSVSISADCVTIASGSEDQTTRLWNIQTGECCHAIHQQGYVFYVMFSPRDPQHLISISNQKIWQLDGSGCQIRPPCHGDHAAFSLDGTHFVSCHGETITVYNSSSGGIVTEFQVAGGVHRCSFSPDNRLVAVAINKTVYCWDITTSEPQLIETFVGHTNYITSSIFSSSSTLISSSVDSSVKFWQIRAQLTDPAGFDLNPTSFQSGPIMSVTVQSKEGIAITSDSGGVVKSWDISTGVCKTSFQTPVRYPNERDIQLVKGRVTLAWDADFDIYVWDTKNKGLKLEVPWEVNIPWGRGEDLRISGDGFRVFSLHAPFILAWSLQTREFLGEMEIEYNGSLGSLTVDGSKVWAHWPESNCKGWDFSIPGSTPTELPNTSTPPSSSKFWDSEQARIKNPATGEVVFQLSARFSGPIKVQCDDSYLVAGYRAGEVLILDLTNVK